MTEMHVTDARDRAGAGRSREIGVGDHVIGTAAEIGTGECFRFMEIRVYRVNLRRTKVIPYHFYYKTSF